MFCNGWGRLAELENITDESMKINVSLPTYFATILFSEC
jgi:hypothetical protein